MEERAEGRGQRSGRVGVQHHATPCNVWPKSSQLQRTEPTEAGRAIINLAQRSRFENQAKCRPIKRFGQSRTIYVVSNEAVFAAARSRHLVPFSNLNRTGRRVWALCLQRHAGVF